MAKAKTKDFIQDDRNFNRGTEQGARLMKKSLHELGAGRSILVDKNNRIIAGNKTQLAAIDAGIDEAVVVETTGDKLVVVKRTDVDIDSKEGRELALADNKSTEVNLAWDDVQLQSVADDFGIDLPEWDIKGILEEASPEDFDEDFSLPEGDKQPFLRMAFIVADEQADLINQAIKDAKELEEFKTVETFANENGNGNALYLIVQQWAEQRKLK